MTASTPGTFEASMICFLVTGFSPPAASVAAIIAEVSRVHADGALPRVEIDRLLASCVLM